MTENPKVFISYSHDSPEHKQWVSELAARLRRNGIDAILDQWDLGLGDDVTRFMERGIVDADRVLVICTDKYVIKANADEGGVGYERMIVNSELVQNLGTDKFIPIIRNSLSKEKTPAFLGTRVYADFRDDNQFETEFENLIRELHEIPVVEKPPLGKNPFPAVEIGTQLTEIPAKIGSANEIYITATKFIRARDTFGWQLLLKKIRPNAIETLKHWRLSELNKSGQDNIERCRIVDQAVEIISSLMVFTLAGVESGQEEFRYEKEIIYELTNLAKPNNMGIYDHLYQTLIYVYHSIHGSLCLSTNQIDCALRLVQVKNSDNYRPKHRHIWHIPELMGWSKSFDRNCLEGWQYLVNGFDRWEWLVTIFEGDSELYRTSLVAYYMALNIHELASIIASNKNEKPSTYNSMHLSPEKVPLTFLFEDQDIYEQSVSLLSRNPESVSELWTCLNVTREDIMNIWREWIRNSEYLLEQDYRSNPDVNIRVMRRNVDRHSNLFMMLQS